MRTLLVVPDAAEESGRREARAVVDWATREGMVTDVVTRPTARAVRAADAVWVHALAGVPAFGDDVRAAWLDGCARGMGTLLTLLATPLAQWLGAPGDAPEVDGPLLWHHRQDPWWPADLHDWPGYPHIRGVQGWGSHPLFRGLQRGTFSWMASEGDVHARATFTRPRWPRQVIGVDRSYIHLHADCAVAWEYEIGAARVVCLGANVLFAAANTRLQPQRDVLLRNALAALAPSRDVRVYWPGHRPAAPFPPLEPGALDASAPPSVWPVDHRSPADESWITIGSGHGLCVATGQEGVRELWLHPLCVCDAGLQLRCHNDTTPRTTSLVSSTRHLERQLQFAGDVQWTELTFGDPDAARWALQWTPAGACHSALEVTWRIPLRLQWPMPEWGLQPLVTDLVSAGSRALVRVTGSDGRGVTIAIDGAAHVACAPDPVAPTLRLTSATDRPLCVLVSIADVTEGTAGIDPQVIPAAARRLTQKEERHRAFGAQLESRDAALDDGWRWAVARLRHFQSATEGTHGLMAGYAASRPGWNRSRPGYAWYFGRDTCWCVDALLAAGLFEQAASAIDLLVATRDVTGKVIHEFSTSGVAHYDAADATPLLLRAIAAYTEWTGDVHRVHEWWPAVEQGVAFVRSCDRDGDGLPENTEVGHGWIEMGPLGGGATTSYVAAIWIDALRRLMPVARALHGQDAADRLELAHRQACAGLEGLRLAGGKLALHRTPDGSLVPWVTALDAVPLALGVEAVDRQDTLAVLGSPAFTAPWGVRLLSREDARYVPRGYHTGSVWPLFTGWVGLADFSFGAVDRGVERLRAVARCAQTRNRGAFDEALDGDTGEAAGVCSDQAWSAAALVSTAVYGLLGLRADALRDTLHIGGRLPASLPGVNLRRLRVHRTTLDCLVERCGEDTRWRVTHIAGPALHVESGGRSAVLRPGDDVTRTLSCETRWQG